MMNLKKTALYNEHIALNAKMVEFAGWQMPIQYSSVIAEHQACRTTVGLFDVSHMGEFTVSGPDAQDFLNEVITNDLNLCADGQAMYTVMCHPHGGIIDDLIIYKKSKTDFLVVVNAANTEKDFSWMAQVHESGSWKSKLSNESSKYSQIAIQGKYAEEIVQKSTSLPLSEIGTYRFKEGTFGKDQISCLFARTGYTGEDGFELYVPWDFGPVVWKELLSNGAPFQIKPCGLGARDTLRLEMKYPLYGNELTDETNPIEAGLSWVVKLNKKSFIGKNALLDIKATGPTKKLIGIRLLERGIPRSGYPILSFDGKKIGQLTSGNQSPTLGYGIGIGYVETSYSSIGTPLLLEIRGAQIKCEVTKTPFYEIKKKT
jgi:aminomethyltransferase